MTIEEMKNVDVRTVDPETLVDALTLDIDESLPTVLGAGKEDEARKLGTSIR